MHMGASKVVVEWFIELDDGELSFIDTPLYANTSNLHSHEDMLKGKKLMCGVKNIEQLSFEADREIGQGESASSLQWTVLYDMLLEWIDPKNRYLHVNENLREYSDKTAINAAPYAYGDDLATCSAGPQAKWSTRSAVASSKMALCILRILWTDDSPGQDKSNHHGHNA
jgi:hypothetical protein